MKNPNRMSDSVRRGIARLLAVCVAWSAVPAAVHAAATPLADQPIQTTQAVPANVMLDLSVEFPTAVSYANIQFTFDPNTTYLGYFDSAKCYDYKTETVGGVSAYFAPASTAAAGSNCSGKWSGNWLNWATMTGIDEFRWAMTGGNRAVDLPVSFSDSVYKTILQRSFLPASQGSAKNFPSRVISNTDAGKFTAISTTNSLCVINLGQGVNMRIGGTSSTPGTTSGCSIDKTPTSADFAVNVEVCKTGFLEANCKGYVSADGTKVAYKPTGLMQDNLGKMNFGAFGYVVLDSESWNLKFDGGVLRARMNDLSKEILDTGAFATDPEGLLSSDSDLVATGAINYLNRFGYTSKYYKRYDNVSEMYAESIKYFKNLGPTTGYVPDSPTKNMKDGFPMWKTWNDPIQYWCQQNFIVGIGDVNTHADKNLSGNPAPSTSEPSTMPSNVDKDMGSLKTAYAWTNEVGRLEGLGTLGDAVFSGNAGYYIAGLAYYAHTQDLRSDRDKKQTISTYWVDVFEYGSYKDKNQYWLATKYGGFTDVNNNGVFDSSSDIWNANKRKAGSAGSTPSYDIPDNYYGAYDAASMVSGLRSAFSNINKLQGAGAGVGLSSSSFSSTTTDEAVFQVKYDSNSWTGDVKAFRISSVDTTTGAITLAAKWSAAANLATLVSGTGWDSQRKVVAVTKNTSGVLVGKPFRKDSLSADDLTTLGSTATEQQNVINYLRGDRTNETSGVSPPDGKAYRHRDAMLGDIVSSKAVYVGPPSAQYSDAFNQGYSAFVSKYKDRKPVVFVGANDGMLHAFDADTSGTGSGGTELFALVPNAAFNGPDNVPATSGLVALTSKTYSHRYYVDATPEVRDIDMSRAGGATPSDATTSDWRSLMVFGLGKGGRSFVALDVTDPSTWTSETAVAGKVLWEFKDADMGFSYGRPLITKMRKYGWVVVLTGGYNNTLNKATDGKPGQGVIYVLNPRNGSVLERIYTGSGSAGSPSGLAQVTGYTQDYTDYTTEQIYGGDLDGNVWRFDVSQTSSDALPNPVKIATLKDSDGKAQPVTTAPQVEYGASDLKRYVFIGTGKMLHSDDLTKDPSRSQRQTFYALRDGNKLAPYTDGSGGTIPTGASFPVARDKLVEVTDLVAGATLDSKKPMGWYYDLPGVETGTMADGSTVSIRERVVINPQANDGVIVWVGTRMNTDPCSPLGKSSIYAVKYGSGKSVLTTTVDGITTPQAFATSSDGLVGMQQVRYGGGVRLLGTSSSGDPAFYGSQIAGFGEPRIVNWRIVGQ